MKRVVLFCLSFVFILSCARIKEEANFDYNPVFEKRRGTLVLNFKIEDGNSYSEKVSLLKERLSFNCVSPDLVFMFEEKARQVFPDFDLSFEEKEEAISVVVKPAFLAKLQGGLVFKSNYLVKGVFNCSAEIKGHRYDCSCVAWKVYTTSDMEKAESFCPDHPVEYLITYEVAPLAVKKCLLRLRKNVLEAMGYPVDEKLEQLSQIFYEEWLKLSK